MRDVDVQRCAHKTKSQNKNKFYAPHFLKTLVRAATRVMTDNLFTKSVQVRQSIFSNMQKYYFPRFHKSGQQLLVLRYFKLY